MGRLSDRSSASPRSNGGPIIDTATHPGTSSPLPVPLEHGGSVTFFRSLPSELVATKLWYRMVLFLKLVLRFDIYRATFLPALWRIEDMESGEATILLVDDDPQVREIYAEFLSTQYIVWTAVDGQDALDQIDSSVDLVLLDRRMPGLSGDEVLEELRHRGFDCPVIIVTAIYPDFDIVTMSFNDYVIKPVSRDELNETIERALALSERDIQVQDYFALVTKKRALEAEKPPAQLESNEAYANLKSRIADLRQRTDPPISEFEERLAKRLSSDESPEPNQPFTYSN